MNAYLRNVFAGTTIAKSATCGAACITFLAAVCTFTAGATPELAWRIGMRYLAADPALRAEMENVRLVVGQATYVGPLVILGTANWEKDWYFRNHGPVSYDPAIYPGQYPRQPWRWWYLLKNRLDGRTCWAYAESSDGIHWTKPILHPGGNALTPEPNNIVQHPTGYLNPRPDAPATERYLRVFSHSDDPAFHRLYAQTSPDGVNFAPPVLVFEEPTSRAYALDGGNQIYWDAAEGNYVLTVRYWYDASGNPSPGSGMNSYRGGATKRSPTIVGLLSAPLEYNLKPNVLYGPITDNCDDIYTTNIVAYHGQFIATPNIFHAPRDNYGKSSSDLRGVSGPVYPQFLYSRDSKTWHADPETRGASLIDLARHNGRFEEEGDMIFTEPIVERDRRIWFFYSYRDFPHNSHGGKDEKTRTMTTHIAQMRIDGFMAVANQPGGIGTWTTPAMAVPANAELRLNVLVGAGGSVRVEMLEPNGSPIPGYTAKDCAPIRKGDYLAAVPSWRGSRSLKGVSGRSAKIRFILSDASLYSFEFARVRGW